MSLNLANSRNDQNWFTRHDGHLLSCSKSHMCNHDRELSYYSMDSRLPGLLGTLESSAVGGSTGWLFKLLTLSGLRGT